VVGQPQTEVLTIAQSGDSGKLVLFTLVYILNFVLLACFTRFKDARFLGLPLLLLLGWCLVSTTWSVLPDGTIRRVVAMTGTLIVGLYAGQRFNEDRLSAAFCTAATVACIALAGNQGRCAIGRETMTQPENLALTQTHQGRGSLDREPSVRQVNHNTKPGQFLTAHLDHRHRTSPRTSRRQFA
jgi:hypothetical protein